MSSTDTWKGLLITHSGRSEYVPLEEQTNIIIMSVGLAELARFGVESMCFGFFLARPAFEGLNPIADAYRGNHLH